MTTTATAAMARMSPTLRPVSDSFGAPMWEASREKSEVPWSRMAYKTLELPERMEWGCLGCERLRSLKQFFSNHMT